MKTLINKWNPQIRITAPEIEKVYDKYYYIIDVRLQFLQENWTLVEEQKQPEEICSKCVYHKKDDGYCYYPHGGMKRRINGDGVYECTAFWEREQEEPKPAEFDEYKIIKKHITEDMLSSEVNKRLTECGWYVTEHKPAEWSKKDEENIGKLHRLLVICQSEKKFIPTSEYEKLDKWLESLHPQPKQEWSEEDEHRCKDAIYFLETAKKHYADTSEIELTIDWLKSLKERITINDKNYDETRTEKRN